MVRKAALSLYLIVVLASSAFSQNNVLTQHYNSARTGWYNRENILNKNNVTYGSFGKLFSRAAHCYWTPYHGWIIGYDATTLQQVSVYNDTPEGYNGGIWMSGNGPSVDKDGNIYVGVGNGSAGKNGNISNTVNISECAVKLTPNGSSLSVSSFFTPTDYAELEAGDLDFGTTNQLLIPNSNQLVTGSTAGSIFLLDRDNMGGYSSNSCWKRYSHAFQGIMDLKDRAATNLAVLSC